MGLESFIDLTNLKADATITDIEQLCDMAENRGFFSVCVNPSMVKIAYNRLIKSRVKICAVIGFPLGANTLAIKVAEAKEAIKNGADELDMVMNIGMFKQGDYKYILDEINAIAGLGLLTKVIVETCYLTDIEIAVASRIVRSSKASFIKTSTGFGKGGATLEHIRLLRQNIGGTKGIKAAGGIRTFESAILMAEAGADRIGASAVYEELMERKPINLAMASKACAAIVMRSSTLECRKEMAQLVKRNITRTKD